MKLNLMPHTKPITIGIIYRSPNQSKFLDIFEENLPNLPMQSTS